MQHEWGRGGLHIGYWWGIQKEGDHWEDQGTTVTNQNLIHEEINKRLNSGNACYHSVQKFLSSGLLSKNVKIII
jgi:hypothetical protein